VRGADQVTLLETLPLSVPLDLDNLGRTVFCHASPRDDEEVVLVDSRLERWAEVFSTLDKPVSGHTHMPFVAGRPSPRRQPRQRRDASWRRGERALGVAR
jgi:hypothetical protein